MGSASANATDDKDFMISQGIVYESFSPLCGPCPAADKEELFNGDLISSIAQRHGKTNAQGKGYRVLLVMKTQSQLS